MSRDWDYLYNTEKLNYVRGQKPAVECILCALRDHNPAVVGLEVKRTDRFIIACNLYPFNMGHVMIFPLRHVTDLGELTGEEALEQHRLLAETLKILKEEFAPVGFNVGYNLGEGSGASIAHVHLHVVPRYHNELGFLDVVAGARVLVLDPAEARDRLQARFAG